MGGRQRTTLFMIKEKKESEQASKKPPEKKGEKGKGKGKE